MTTIAQISDCHLVFNRLFKGIDSYKRLKQVIDSLPNEVDLIVMTGDLTHHADFDSYRLLQRLIATLSIPVVVLSGNHDDAKMLRRVLGDFIKQSVALQKWQLICLDSVVPKRVSGYLDKEKLKQLTQQLKYYEKQFCLLALHHPIVPMASDWDDTLSLTNADDLWQVLKQFKNVKGVIWGHAHEAKTFHQGQLTLYSTPATAGGHKCLDDYGYRIMKLNDNGTMTSDVVWMT